ncbi:hypothetical protein ACFSCZ_13770 [Siminovitchia sediminis]|uniref:Uncharacterized protein n=1 Tax=Siminovitchia sediminis TaxID=1274353 RepID=A0ABW4KI23_9BACI
MQLGVVIGLSIFLGVAGFYLFKVLASILDSSDANTVDELPADQQDR